MDYQAEARLRILAAEARALAVERELHASRSALLGVSESLDVHEKAIEMILKAIEHGKRTTVEEALHSIKEHGILGAAIDLF